MKKFYLVLAAVTGMTLASCTQNEYVGEVATPKADSEAIGFGGGFKAVTRDTYGADAAGSLGSKFIVAGVKGDGTGASQTDVFKSYLVEWEANTAGTTESNTADWEYVGKKLSDEFFTAAGITEQAIKYWDFSTTAYDFCAYSVGTGSATGSVINYANAATGAYTLTGSRADLEKCYITDMKTVAQAQYKNEVELEFRSLATKARVAIYETVPGYSVKDVKFHSTDVTRPITPATSTKATLFGTDAFNGAGTYTVTFPKIGSGNSSDPDYNKAHVTFTPDGTGGTTSVQEFGDLTGTLGTTSKAPTFANRGNYTTVLPNENGAILELCVDYTLVSTDGSNETITVYGAKAFVPAAYTKWLSNYAYTYIFKISDNTNGWTNPKDDPDDPEGLFPITFDAVVLDSEETGTQTTITTVATPSITTYQKGHVYDASDEYKAGDIYVMAQTNGTPVSNFATTNTFLYTLDDAATEALVMDALNIRASEASGVITGRNGLVLTPADFDATITAIPGEDGNDITVAAGSAVKFAAATGTYAFVYYVGTEADTDVITAVALTSEPSDWDATDNVYYTDAACTTQANDAYADGTYYKKYTNLNNVYGVKVIKVQ